MKKVILFLLICIIMSGCIKKLEIPEQLYTYNIEYVYFKIKELSTPGTAGDGYTKITKYGNKTDIEPVIYKRKNISNEKIRKYTKYIQEVIDGKHPPYTIYNLGDNFKMVDVAHDSLQRPVMHLAVYNSQTKTAQYLGFIEALTKYENKDKQTGHNLYSGTVYEVYFIKDDEHKKHFEELSEKWDDAWSNLMNADYNSNYVYLEREFGDQLYNSKRYIITLEEINKYNMGGLDIIDWFVGSYPGSHVSLADNAKNDKRHFE